MSVFKRATWESGAGIVSADLTSMSSYLLSQVLDTMGHLARGAESDIDPAATACFCVGNSGAPYAHTSGLTIKNLGGVLLQKQAGSIDGDAPKLLAYYLAPEELNTTFSAADPTNPRIDLIAVKIDEVDDTTTTRHYKDATTGALTTTSQVVTKGVRLQKQVVTGTPGATPAEPSVPSGYVKYCTVRVAAAATALVVAPYNQINRAGGIIIADHRMPIGISVIDMHAARDGFWDDAKWAFRDTQGRALMHSALAADPNDLIVAPSGPLCYSGRILWVGVSGMAEGTAGAFQVHLSRWDIVNPDITSNFTHQVDIGPTNPDGLPGQVLNADGLWQYREVAPYVPFWMNGEQAGYAYRPMGGHFTAIAEDQTRAVVSILPAVDETLSIQLVRFIVAGM